MDARASSYASILMKYANDWALPADEISCANNDGNVRQSVLVDTFHVYVSVGLSTDVHVLTGDTSIRATIDQRLFLDVI